MCWGRASKSLSSEWLQNSHCKNKTASCEIVFIGVQLFETLWTVACQASVPGIFQARILACVAISFSRRSSQPRDLTHVTWVACIGRQILYLCAPWEAPVVRLQTLIKSLRIDYSAIKKNTFESVLMKWMKLEPIIQSEVSQKEKHQYSILMHIYGI